MNALIRQFKQITPLCLVGFALGCFAELPKAQAVSPPLTPDAALRGGNTADGQNALASITTGMFNSAFGIFSLLSNTTANFNTGVGAGTLLLNDAEKNTAVGAGALFTNTGANNAAVGAFAMFSNENGASNSAVGSEALILNTTGDRNTAIGFQALSRNTIGAFNTATGVEALSFNTTGNFNIALGVGAGSNVTTANNVICINSGGSNLSDTTWINNIFGVTTQTGTTVPVIVSDQGQLGTVASAERFKKNIAAMDGTSENILSLRPVTFHYKSDAKQTPQFGLIAEEVAKVNPALVLHDKDGKPYTVRYDAVNVMLLNEFLKEHRKNAEQEATIARQQQQIEALTAGLEKVNARLEAGKPASQVAL
jgi:hypothetical protein